VSASAHRISPPSQSPVEAGHRPRWRRGLAWFVLFLLVLGVHLAARYWLAQQIARQPEPESAPPPVEVALLTAQPIRRAPPKPAARAPTPRPKAVTAPHEGPSLEAVETDARVRAALAAASSAAAASAAQASAASASDAASAASASAASPASNASSASSASSASIASAASNASSATAAAANATPASAAAASGEQFSLPPAADLRYDTFFNGQRNMPGTISLNVAATR